MTSWWRAGVAEHAGLVDDQRRARPAAGTRAAVAGRCAAIRGAAWRRCRPACRSRARRVRAAFAVGATPNTARPLRVEVVDGGGEHAGLAGAGRADDQHQPVVAGDRRGGVGLQRSSPSRSTVVDGAGGSAWASIAHVRIASSWARTGLGGEAGCGRLDPHRPAIRRPPRSCRRAGRGRRSWSRTWSAARSSVSAQRCPDICDTGRCRSQIACSTSARRPRRPLLPTPRRRRRRR